MSKTTVAAATASKPARARLTLPKGDKAVQAQQAAVEKALKAAASAIPTENIWVNALTNAEGFHRDALQLELAVGLSLFASKADATKVNLPAKKLLREVYAKAGYSCSSPQGEDYKTVVRRVNVAADLFQHIGGRETVADWVADVRPTQQVQAITEHLKNYNFSGINSVLAYMGKAVATKRPREVITQQSTGMSDADKLVAEAAGKQIDARRLAEQQGIPPGRIFTHGVFTVAIPLAASYDDVISVAMDLMTFAKSQLPAPTLAIQSQLEVAAAH